MPRRPIKSYSRKKASYKRRKMDVWKRRKRSSTAKKGRVRYRFNAPENVIGLPQSKVVDFYYTDTVTLATASAAGAAISQVLRPSSLFDPDFTGVGHQPLGHSQWENYYSQYRVESAIIKATFYHSVTGETVPITVGIGMDLDQTLHSTSNSALKEHQRGKYQKILLPNSREKVRIIGKYSLKAFRKKKDKNDDDFAAAMGANPAANAFCHLWAVSENGANSSANVLVRYELWQRAKLMIPLGQSSS